MVKSINILPPGQQGFKFTADILVQTNQGQEVAPFGIMVAAVVKHSFLELLKSDHRRIPALIKMVKNRNDLTSVNGLAFVKLISFNGTDSASGGLVSYSNNQSSLVNNNLISTEFELPQIYRHLNLLVVPYNIDATADSPPGAAYGISEDNTITMGRPIIETVLFNKRPPQTSRLFRLLGNSAVGKAGELWVGPVHRHPLKGLMAGNSHTNDPHPRVKSVSITNQKVKDHRLAAAIASLPMEAMWQSPPPQSHFGPVVYSRSHNNEVGVMIPFNIRTYVKENFAFGKLIKNNSALLSCAMIDDIRVFRTRTQKNNLGSQLTPDKNSASNDCYKIPPTLIGTLKDGQVKLLDFQGPTQMVHHIFVKDVYMADASQSRFEYFIEINIVDDTPNAVASLLRRLDTALYNYESYLFALQADGHLPEDYQTFINANAESLNLRADWKALIVEFLSVIRFLYGVETTSYKSVLTWALKMLPFANPYSASIESAEELKELIRQYRQRLGDLYGKTTVQKSEAPLNQNQQISQASSSKRRLKIIHTIKETYYNELSPTTGFDYLGEFSDAQVGSFDSISHQAYIQRSDAEMNKYGLTNPSAMGVNKYGFLSPRTVRTPNQELQTSTSMPLPESYDIYQANLLPATTEKNFLGNPASFDNESSLANKILNYEGVSYRRSNQPISQIAEEHVSPPSSDKDASLYFGDGSAFVFDNKSEETATYGSDIPSYIGSLKKSADLIDNSLIRQTLNEAISSYEALKATDIEKINGSFAYQQLKFDESSISAMNLFEIEINFNSVVKIEYFAGYNGSLTSPVWHILSPTQLTSLNNGERSTFLCRITDMGSVFNQHNIFKLSSFNQYFILGANPGTSNLAVQSTYESNYETIRSSTKALMLENIVNTNTDAGTCFPQYTISRAMIYSTTTQPTGQTSSPSANSEESY